MLSKSHSAVRLRQAVYEELKVHGVHQDWH